MNTTNLYVRHGGRVPEDVVEIANRTDQQVAFFPAGGGFECLMPTDRFDSAYRAVSQTENVAPVAYAATYDIDGAFGDLPGYSRGVRWNGWACPYFPKASCDRIVGVVGVVGANARFDEASNAYIMPSDDGLELRTYLSQSIVVGEQEVVVWAIGSGAWTWDEER